MQQTEVCLQYACSHCHSSLTARLHCSGEGVAAGPHTITRVKISCPFCRKVSEVYFELSGLIVQVVREPTKLLREPSLN